MTAEPPQHRKINEITADELLAELGTTPRHQIDIFVSLGGDRNDHDYAWMSKLTRQLRRRGHDVRSSKRLGLWLGPGKGQTDPE